MKQASNSAAEDSTDSPSVLPGGATGGGGSGGEGENRPTTGLVPLEEAEILHASLKAGSIAQIVVAMIAIVGLIYLLRFVMVTVLVSLLVACILDPPVSWLRRIGLPRAAGALVTLVLAAAMAGGVGYFLGGRLGSFLAEIPRYSHRIERAVNWIQSPIQKLEEKSHSLAKTEPSSDEAIPVRIEEGPIFSRIVAAHGAEIGKTVFAIGFIPFLTYFMLTWKDHFHEATVHLFPQEHRPAAYRTIARITAMIRSFIVGNLAVGLIAATLYAVVFGLLGIPYFYFLGIISGFVNLIPSLGAFLALLPPLAGGMGILTKTGVVIVLGTVVGTHALIMNVLYPKLIGPRARLNPLAVVLSLLFWSWIWGPMGLVLAIPIVGSTKIVCDYVDSLRGVGAWLGDKL
ncbi:MAG TPA: AI-2E family transporter [Acidobacteriaceae bacterium]|nr:AI-2E family transporter [Acidobacteriaceae bacterium]